jgi:prefoldin subunit 5
MSVQMINLYAGREETILSMRKKIEQYKLIKQLTEELKNLQDEADDLKKILNERGVPCD